MFIIIIIIIIWPVVTSPLSNFLLSAPSYRSSEGSGAVSICFYDAATRLLQRLNTRRRYSEPDVSVSSLM